MQGISYHAPKTTRSSTIHSLHLGTATYTDIMNALLASLLALSLFSGWLFYQQPAMIFFPERKLVATPADWGLEYQDVSLETEDAVRLHGWFIPHRDSSRVVLFLHGNAGNISHRRDSVAIFHRLGLNVLIFDYRGYGNSQGKPSEGGLYADAHAAWQYLVREKGFVPSQITIFGRSLGGAVAGQLAAQVQPGAVILESTFSSARDMANAVFPALSRLVPMRFDFATVERIKQVTSPVLVIHSEEDEIIPFRLGQRVYRAANSPKTLLKIHGGHNGGFLSSQPAYEQALGEFISRFVPEAGT